MTEETTLLQYRITRNADRFVAIDSTDDILGVFHTEQEATREIERAKLDDAMWKHAKIMFHASVLLMMDSFNVDRQTARYYVSSAAEQA